MPWGAMERSRWLVALWAGFAWTLAAATVGVFLAREPIARSYFASSSGAAWIGFGAAAALLAAGTYAVLVMAPGPYGTVCLAAGCVWLSPVWVGWEGGPPALRAVAAMLPPMMVPLLAHLVLASSYAARWRVVLPVYLAFGVVAVVAGAVLRPIEDLHAFANLSDFTLVVPAPELAEALVELLRVLTVAAAVVLPAVVAARVLVTRSAAGAWLWVPALIAVVLEGLVARTLMVAPEDRFDAQPGLALFPLRGLALCAVAATTWWVARRRRVALRRMAALVRELAQQAPAGGVEHALRVTLDDPGLEVRYWIRQDEVYADASGHVSDVKTAGRGVVRVVRGSEPVALVTHDSGRWGHRTLRNGLGAPATLAIDNERLRAESLAHLVDLTESRARLVAAADHERRRLERDLHDGAQQRLLAVTYELRLGRADAAAAGQPVDVLDEAIACASRALGELREFAHGVFPAVLDESGLEDALWTLTDRAGTPVRLRCDLGGPAPAAGPERTAYLAAKAAIDSAPAQLDLDVSRGDGRLMLTARGVGDVDVVHLADRVGAAGGALRRTGDRLEVVIPCAS